VDPVKVWLGGEGSSDIGDRDQWEERRERAGALEALLLKVEASGWIVLGATRWKSLRKYVAGGAVPGGGKSEGRNVKGLLLLAREKNADVVAFLRDIDKDERRDDVIESGITEAHTTDSKKARSPGPVVIAGFPRPNLEAWILALHGEPNTDSMSAQRVENRLAALGICDKKAEDYVAVIEEADVARLPPGCDSLQAWRTQAERLTAAVHGKVNS
jgi:hypothetical protein